MFLRNSQKVSMFQELRIQNGIFKLVSELLMFAKIFREHSKPPSMRVSLTLKGFYTHWEKAKQKPQRQGEPPPLPHTCLKAPGQLCQALGRPKTQLGQRRADPSFPITAQMSAQGAEGNKSANSIVPNLEGPMGYAS